MIFVWRCYLFRRLNLARIKSGMGVGNDPKQGGLGIQCGVFLSVLLFGMSYFDSRSSGELNHPMQHIAFISHETCDHHYQWIGTSDHRSQHKNLPVYEVELNLADKGLPMPISRVVGRPKYTTARDKPNFLI